MTGSVNSTSVPSSAGSARSSMTVEYVPTKRSSPVALTS
jgi:hypothetical protein